MLACSYLQMDKAAEALSMAQQGVMAHPNYSTGHVVLAMALDRVHNFTDAKKELLTARELHPVPKLSNGLSQNSKVRECPKGIPTRTPSSRGNSLRATEI